MDMSQFPHFRSLKRPRPAMAFETLMAQVVSHQLQSPTIAALARAPRLIGAGSNESRHAATQHLFAGQRAGEFGANRGLSSFHADIAQRLLTEGQSL